MSSYKICVFCLLLICLQCTARMPDLEAIRSQAILIDRSLGDFVSRASGYEHIERIYNENSGRFQFGEIDGMELVNQIADDIGRTLGQKMEALQESVNWAEELARNYTWNEDLTIDTVNYVHAKRIDPDDESYTYSEQFKQNVNMNISSVHIPVEIYEGDIHILNGLEWSKRIDEQWRRNKEEDNNLLWQYFGSQEGIMRNFPSSRWRGEGVDLYDVRRRPWYTQGASSPKDMLILVDTSGSTFGQALALTKHAVQSLLDTLGDNDFVNVAHFSDEAQWVGCFKTFVQANYRNKRVLFDNVQQLKAKNMASYNKGFQFAFEEFEKYGLSLNGSGSQFNETEQDGSGRGANCNRIIMLLTDGGTEMPTEIFEKYNWPEKRTRIFTYAIGPTANPIAAVRWIACSNRGYFARIPAMGAIRSTVQEHVPVVARPLARERVPYSQWSNIYNDALSEYVSVLGRPMAAQGYKSYDWTDIHYDIRGLGMMTTVTLPVYNRTNSSDSNQTILGVMGCDVTVKEMEESIPYNKLGANGYVFAINNNGYVIFHPFLKAQDGWLEDPPNVDLLDIEYENDEKTEMRRAMIDRENSFSTIHTYVHMADEMHVDNKSRVYYYTPIDSSSFSLGLVLPEYMEQFVASVASNMDAVEGVTHLLSDFSDVFLAPWEFCPGLSTASNTSTNTEDLVNKLENNEIQDCDESMLQYLLLDAKLTKQMDPVWNAEVDSMPSEGVRTAFVSTNGGMTRVFPQGNEELFSSILDTNEALYYGRTLDNDDQWMYFADYHAKNDFAEENFTAPIVMAVRSLQFDTASSYRYGVVGVQLEQSAFRPMVYEQLPACYTDSSIICYLLDDGGFLIYTSEETPEAQQNVGMFLGDFDLPLMRVLHNKTVYIQKEMYDFQASCEIITGTTDAAPSVKMPVIFEALSVSWWSSKFTWLYLNFNLYSWLMSFGAIFTDSQVAPQSEDIEYASCIKHLAQYHFNTDAFFTDSKYNFRCGDCTRTYISARMPGSNLLFVMVTNCTSPMICDDTPMLQRPVESPDPGFIDGHCSVKTRYRKRPEGCYDYDEYEDNSDCASGSRITPSLTIFIVMCVPIMYNLWNQH